MAKLSFLAVAPDYMRQAILNDINQVLQHHGQRFTISEQHVTDFEAGTAGTRQGSEPTDEEIISLLNQIM